MFFLSGQALTPTGYRLQVWRTKRERHRQTDRENIKIRMTDREKTEKKTGIKRQRDKNCWTERQKIKLGLNYKTKTTIIKADLFIQCIFLSI